MCEENVEKLTVSIVSDLLVYLPIFFILTIEQLFHNKCKSFPFSNRWHVIVPVDSYIVNMLNILDQHNNNNSSFGSGSNTNTATITAAVGSVVATGAGASAAERRLNATRNSSHNSSGSYGSSSGSTSRVNFTDSCGENGKSSVEKLLPLEALLNASLTPQEVGILERIFPYVQKHAISSKTIGEIVWAAKITEDELTQVVEKIPQLQIVKKLSN